MACLPSSFPQCVCLCARDTSGIVYAGVKCCRVTDVLPEMLLYWQQSRAHQFQPYLFFFVTSNFFHFWRQPLCRVFFPMKARIVNYVVYEARGGQLTDKALCPNTKSSLLWLWKKLELFCFVLHYTVSLVLVCSGRIQIHNLLNLDILFVVTIRKKNPIIHHFLWITRQSVTTERRMLSALQHQTGSAINLFWTDCTVVALFPDALCNRGQI